MSVLLACVLIGALAYGHLKLSEVTRLSAGNAGTRSLIVSLCTQFREQLWNARQILQRHRASRAATDSSEMLSALDAAAGTYRRLEQVRALHAPEYAPVLLQIRTQLDLLRRLQPQTAHRPGAERVPAQGADADSVLAGLLRDIRIIDGKIDAWHARDVLALTGAVERLHHSSWLLGVTGMVFLIMGYLYFEAIVRRPIARITQAMKDVARSGVHEGLPAVRTDEMRDLVQAFSEMQGQVLSRQRDLEHQALHDPLTELPNRTLLYDRLRLEIHHAGRSSDSIALLMVDLDRFKEINDTLGHHIGDRVLLTVSARFRQALRKSDTVARLGGDEFAILAPGADRRYASEVAEKLLKTLEEPCQIDGNGLYLGASIGIAMYPDHGADANTLLQRADVAMYLAKRSGCGFAVYDPGQDDHSVSRLSLVGELRHAIQQNLLELHFQPKIDLGAGRVAGVEALVRWNHAEHGYIPPEEFIPLAERSGLINPLTHRVLNASLRQCSQWRRKGFELDVAVNFSAVNLQDLGIHEKVADLLRLYGVDPHYLEVEITESAMMSDPKRAMESLARLTDMGVRVSVDDYGTGFSSLAYLKLFPVAILKIDKSFVMDMLVDENDAVIVRSTIDLAHNLGKKVIAEGVENKEIWDLLEILRCDTAQGYYISRPMPAHELEDWLCDSQWEVPRYAVA